MVNTVYFQNILLNAVFSAMPTPTSAASLAFEERMVSGVKFAHIFLDPNDFGFTVVSPSNLNGVKQTLLFNGGYYEPDDKPSGLLISNGVNKASKSDDPKLSGVFYTKGGKAYIVWTASYVQDSEVSFALQNGPLIIEPGGKKGIRSDDGRLFQRTVIALDKQGKFHLFIFKTPISLFTCQAILMGAFPAIDSALNLDGGPSTFFWLKYDKYSSYSGRPQALPYLVKISPK